MQKLEDIGFYTLSNNRLLQASPTSPLSRCELVLTSLCNFRCQYCIELRREAQGHLSTESAKRTVGLWLKDGLKNIRFTGGEPMLHPALKEFVALCKEGGVEHIAISTNGSAPLRGYEDIVEAGVNDFSVSLDACCAQVGDSLSRTPGSWNKAVETIKFLSKKTYVTLGMVFTGSNIGQCKEAVLFADSLGPSDIRVIPSSQYNQALVALADLPQEVLAKYPILRYRIQHVQIGRGVRGLQPSDTGICTLILDDMAVAGDYHFPCIIYLRQGGDPIGKVSENMREERLEWSRTHNTQEDPICKRACLDCLIDYNNLAQKIRP